MKISLLLMTLSTLAATQLHVADTSAAATAVNALGVDLLAKTTPGANALLSPYSIQNALAMAYAGADGKTREEMAKVLHFPKDDAVLNGSFSALEKQLVEIEKSTAKMIAGSKDGGPKEAITLSVANRLFGQKGYEFRKPFLEVVKESYGAPLEQLDFHTQFEKSRSYINNWVEEQTHKRIRDLIPSGGITPDARLVLVNAVYLKAAWAEEFKKSATAPLPFHASGKEKREVPTMNRQDDMGFARRDGYTAVTIPYIGSELQFLILLPDDAKSLAGLESKLTPALLASCAELKTELVNLYLPKFKLEPPLMQLSAQLKTLGMKTAFDDPKGSADFDAMAPRKPNDYLYISEVFHKTFLALDENGTEAAAATAVAMFTAAGIPENPPKPVVVRVDHPFLFAIQHRASGACLFLGRVTDPR